MMRPATTLATAALLATVALLAGCGDDDTTEPSDFASARIVNASSGTSALTATSPDDGPLATGLAFQNTNAANACSTVDKNEHGRIDFTSGAANTAVGSVDQYFVAKQSYTVVFLSPNNAMVLPESFATPASGNMALRFINATSAPGDLYLTTPTGAISGPPTIANLGAGAVSGFSDPVTSGGTFEQYSTANTRVRLFNVGTTTGTPRADFTISNLASNRVGTVVLTPPPTGGTTTGFLVSPCAN